MSLFTMTLYVFVGELLDFYILRYPKDSWPYIDCVIKMALLLDNAIGPDSNDVYL